MKQLVQYRSESEKVVGWNAYQCPHCHRIIDSPYGPEKVHCDCHIIPDASDWKAWLALFSAAAGVTRALAICQYIRWRFKGSKLEELPPGVPQPNVLPIPAPAEGPGTELKKILAWFHIEPTSSCQCQSRIDQMNIWGVDGCRRHRSEITEWLRDGYDTSNLSEKFTAFGVAVWRGLPKTIAGLVDEAIRRSELHSSAERGTMPA